MKIIQVLYRYYPDSVAGSEIYAESLSKKLVKFGCYPIITAPSDSDNSYSFNGLDVNRFKTDYELNSSLDLYENNDSVAEKHFEKIVRSVEPDIIHLHNSSVRIANYVINVSGKYDIPVILTVHTPAFTCIRNTLLLWGSEPCDGEILINRCTTCYLNSHNIPQTLARLAAKIPLSFSELPAHLELRGGIWTALRMKELVTKRTESLMKVIGQIDRIVTLNDLSIDVLVRNGVAREKIKLIRSGIETTNDSNSYDSNTDSHNENKINLAFMGRIVPVKGIHILMEALDKISEADLSLDIYGISVNPDDKYEIKLRDHINSDQRVNLKESLDHRDVIKRLKQYNYLVLPSQWIETAPLIIQEAFAAGIPVIGSDLGGIKEMIKNGHNGILVRYDSIEEWAKTLKMVANDTNIYRKLKSNISPPRTMEDVAMEMIDVYSEVLAK